MTNNVVLLIIKVGVLTALVAFAFAESNLKVILKGDPDEHKKGVTYDTIEFLSRYTIDAKLLMPIDGQCSRNCSVLTNVEFMYYNNKSYDPEVLNKICLGGAHDCIAYENSQSNNEVEQEYFYCTEVLKESEEECKRRALEEVQVEACDACRCYCDNSKNPNMRASFCLDAVGSNIAEGYVVTGVRFRVIDRTIITQVRQGKLVDNKAIDPSTLEWVPVNECIHKERMTYNFRSLQMHDAVLSEGTYVTGIYYRAHKKENKFTMAVIGKKPNDLKNLNIKLETTEIPHKPRENLITPYMDIPTSSPNKNNEFSKSYENYIKFTLPHLEKDNESNELIPFIDTQDVVSDTKPLRGVGVYWRGKQKIGGFTAFKVFVENDASW